MNGYSGYNITVDAGYRKKLERERKTSETVTALASNVMLFTASMAQLWLGLRPLKYFIIRPSRGPGHAKLAQPSPKARLRSPAPVL